MRTLCSLTALAVAGALVSALCAHAQLLPQAGTRGGKPGASKPAQIVVQTSPNAQVYLDDVFKGQASSKGRLIIENPPVGHHVLRVSLPRRKNVEQNIAVTAGQAIQINAPLPESGATVEVRTSPGAAIFLDDSPRGTADAAGQLAITDIVPGAHQLRVTLAGKKEYRQYIDLTEGQEASVSAPLADAGETLVVQTSPGAAIFLDDSPRGAADASGRLSIAEVAAGTHQLRVSAPGKAEYKQTISVVAGQGASIAATLGEPGGNVLVQTSPGAAVFLDDSRRGSAGPSGQFTLAEVAAGPHQLRVSAPGKRDYQQSVTVAAGQDLKVDATLGERGPAIGEVRVNPKDGLKYVWISPGNFAMGCSPGDAQCSPLEKPTHRLSIGKGFWMGQTEVTVGAYKRFAEQTFRKLPAAPSFNPNWVNEAMPIVQVNWDSADNYCRWAGGRLPTEAEWEYAARAGTTEPRYGPLDEVAWYNSNSGSLTHPVAQKRPNGFSLFDMLGNAAEWVHDRYSEHYYENSPTQDPMGPEAGKQRVIRGRGWDDIDMTVRASQREYADQTGRFSDVGFRCGGDVFGP